MTNESTSDTTQEQPSRAPENGTPQKVEVSASTIARMMGVATQTDLKLLDGKLDLIATKINTLTAKIDRIQTAINSAPTSSDFDRLDINFGSLKGVVREVLEVVQKIAGVDPAKVAEAEESAEQSKKLRSGIKTNAKNSEEGVEQ